MTDKSLHNLVAQTAEHVVRRILQKEKKGLQSETNHSLNLRCPKCNYSAKTTDEMLVKGRLRCPVDHCILRTKEERGETRGRKAS